MAYRGDKMLEIKKNKDIVIPHGDSLRFDFSPEHYVMMPEDMVVFTVKKKIRDTEACIRKEYQGIQLYGNIINIKISADEMKQFPAGTYVYDLVVKNKDTQMLLLGPAKIKITEVVNNE